MLLSLAVAGAAAAGAGAGVPHGDCRDDGARRCLGATVWALCQLDRVRAPPSHSTCNLHTVALKVTIATCLDGRAFTGPFIAFILPSLCHLKLFPAQSTQSKLLGYCIVVVGLVGSLVATTISIIELDKAFSSSDGG